MKLKYENNDINDIKQYLHKVRQKNASNITTKKNNTKNININKLFSNNGNKNMTKHLTPNQTKKLLEQLKENKEQKLLKKRINIENVQKSTKIDYKTLIQKFKDDSLNIDKIGDKNFIIWYCQWKKYINMLYKNSEKIYKWLNINLKGKDIDSNNKNYYNILLDSLKNEQYKVKIFGNEYSFVLVLGLLIKRLKRKNTNIYDNILQNAKISYQNEEKVKDDSLNVDNILDAILKQLEFFELANELSEPFAQLYTNFDPIVKNNKNCFSKVLNDIYYYRYLINLVNLKGNSKITLENLLDHKQNLELIDVMDLGTKIDKKILQKLSPTIVKKLFSTTDKGKMFVWISKLGYIVTMGEIQKNRLIIKTIGHRLLKNDKFTLTQYNKDKIDVVVKNIGQVYQQILGTKKQIDIICDGIIINLRKNKKNSITIMWNNNVFYNLIFENKKYKLKALCIDKISAPDIAQYFYTNEKLNLTIFGPIQPFEVMIILAIGFAIKLNMGNIFINISSEVISENIDCEKYVELSQNFLFL
jgi:hypothetical protein